MPLTTRRRTIPFFHKGKAGMTTTSSLIGNEQAITGEFTSQEDMTLRDAQWSGTQVTVSEGHPVSQLRKPGLQDIGGEFETTKSYVAQGPYFGTTKFQYIQNPNLNKVVWKGFVYPYIPVSGGKLQFPPNPRSSNSVLDNKGATAIARCKPTNPPVDAATAIGELYREGLPHLIGANSWKDRAVTAKSAGSDYLNVQFGWRPLIGEISNFAETVSKFDTVLAQYERDAGKVVRRRYEFPEERTYSEVNVSNINEARAVYLPFDNNLNTGSIPGTVYRTRETVRNTWFSGAFTYYLPRGYDSRDKVSKLRLMADRLGIQASPDTVWELTPWSWAVDWFSNAGDVISNVSDFATGGLVMRYGYVMEHSITTDTYSLVGSKPGINAKHLPAGEITLVTETKVRRQANPFGFGVTWEGLSTFQASILAALGITRGSR
jgi:hypothetical protein